MELCKLDRIHVVRKVEKGIPGWYKKDMTKNKQVIINFSTPGQAILNS